MLVDLDPSPAYESLGPPRLYIHGASWGGIIVTDAIRAMVSATQSLDIDMRAMCSILAPDPAVGIYKTLTVLYQYEDQEVPSLLTMSEGTRINQISIVRDAKPVPYRIQTLDRPWRAEPHGEVEILAALYGPQKIETPAALHELAAFFEGRRGQIRMNTGFFRVDTWVNHKKSWAVYFRFVGSKRIQCVTGMEEGALEIPWRKDN
ncbi:hypothetical protein GQ53DRAFT_647484 [Thozetella sp. PMI_491]|nr:hypothetical protein GQ53DRAFT_647484 [Thozetella sp. PMI_491]